jgi:hypothetical protein
MTLKRKVVIGAGGNGGIGQCKQRGPGDTPHVTMPNTG